jgi:SAM-dependent methyltransferase
MSGWAGNALYTPYPSLTRRSYSGGMDSFTPAPAQDAELERRLEAERAFHNAKFAGEEHQPSSAIYELPRVAYRWFEGEVQPLARGAEVLEFGCGGSSYAVKLSQWSGRVTAIDISDEAVEETRRRVEDAGFAAQTRLIRMNAEELDFPEGSFDLVVGRAILHHLDLEKSYAAIARVLKPGGAAIFLEPLAHNPLINLYRRMTPNLRTEDEHPLTMRDLAAARKHFGEVRLRYFTLLSIGALAAAKAPRLFGAMVKGLDKADAALFRVAPLAGRWAWTAGMVMVKAA